MKKKLLLVLIPLLMVFSTKINAQCTNSTIRPGDGFTLQGWSTTCNGGSDGYIRISGITSSSSASPNANRPYFARILTAVGGGIHPSYPTPFPIPAGGTFDIPNLPAGSYVVDIIDGCGGTSADKAVTITQPNNPEFTLNQPIIIRRITSPSGTCGDTFVVKVPFTRFDTGQTLSVTFTNSANQTYTPANNIYTIARASQQISNPAYILVEVPVNFFLGSTITANLSSNQCSRPVQTQLLTFPPSFQVPSYSGFTIVQSTTNTCVSGYSITRNLYYGTANVAITIVETNSPSTPALDINGNPLSFTYPTDYVWQDAIQIFSGLKFDVPYTITYTDACGLTVTENLNIPSPAAAAAIAPSTCYGPTEYSTFVDDAGILGVNLPNDKARSFPISFTITNGPSTWTSTLGETTVTAPLTYPQVYTFNTTGSSLFYLGTNIVVGSPLSDNNVTRSMQFAPGTYTIKYEDACGRTNTFNVTIQGASCIRNSTTSYVVNYCNYTNGNVDLSYTISPKGRDTRALYRINGDGSETLVSTQSNNNATVIFNNIPPGTYKVRFGGVIGVKMNYPGIGGVNGIPRIAGTNYIYEETVIVKPLEPLTFANLEVCNGSVTGVAVGGQAPYQYTLLDAAGTTIVQPTQTSGTFNGLTLGTTYTIEVTDSCGRTFNQKITINNLTAPTISNVAQSTCSSSNNSVTVSNLPTGTWILTDSFDGTVTNGSGTTYTFNNLPVGNHSFVLSNSLGCTAPATASVTINPQPTTLNLVVTNPAIACTGSTVDITAATITAGSDAGIILAYFEDTAATIPLANANSITAAGTYYIQATAGSCSSIQPVVVTFNNCTCQEPPTDLTTSVPVKQGITILGRAGANNGNWPMLRNSAYTVLESKTKGFVITRIANPETTITDPKVGMMVFDTDENAGKGCLKIFVGPSATDWKCFGTQTCP